MSRLDEIEARHHAIDEPGLDSNQQREALEYSAADVPGLVAALRKVDALHRPHRTHNAISNPDFWYSVCHTCIGPDGESALYPCPTVVAMQNLGGAS